jgi:hypothetical protein
MEITQTFRAFKLKNHQKIKSNIQTAKLNKFEHYNLKIKHPRTQKKSNEKKT